jgi:histidyl-tRNA synthetase
MPKHSFQAPNGTRDFYPADLLRRRYIEKLWRDTSIRHGFAEIDGPTFEHLDLYTVKSGDGIVSELFSFKRDGGEKDFALRPEFTPTLARLYAAKANALPKPTKWFWQQTCFRAERPQRGRLREFMQWNCDILGEHSPRVDADAIAVAVDLLIAAGFHPGQISVKIGSRAVACEILKALGVPPTDEALQKALVALDKSAKLRPQDFETECAAAGFSAKAYRERASSIESGFTSGTPDGQGVDISTIISLRTELAALGIADWCTLDLNIARGLAYYTGVVFEVIVDGERAVAGGGRYDNLIELVGGPPTPAIGFGMGDVVLALILQDKGLMPSDDDLLDLLSAPSASYRPQAFIIAANDAADAGVRPLVAQLRRAGLHARSSSKTTRNLGKLLQDATAQKSLHAVILETPDSGKIKDLTAQSESPLLPIADILTTLRASTPRANTPRA